MQRVLNILEKEKNEVNISPDFIGASYRLRGYVKLLLSYTQGSSDISYSVSQSRASASAWKDFLYQFPEKLLSKQVVLKTSIFVTRKENPIKDAAILYFHGGGLISGSAAGELGNSIYCERTGIPMLHVEHRLLPEHSLNEALEDAVEGYKHLIETVGASKIIVMGTSAGAIMSFLTVLKLKQLGVDVSPIKLMLLVSPIPGIDVMMGDSFENWPSMNLPLSKIAYLDKKAYTFIHETAYKGERADSEVTVKELIAHASNLPKIHLTVGEYEVVHDGVVKFAEFLQGKSDGVALEVASKCFHGWNLYLEWLDEANQTFAKHLQVIAETLK